MNTSNKLLLGLLAAILVFITVTLSVAKFSAHYGTEETTPHEHVAPPAAPAAPAPPAAE